MNLTETETTYTLTGEVACDSCDGTGLYVGMAERSGAAVVCTNCNGTGKVEFKRTFKKFKNRKVRKGVERVYETAAGYCISAKDVTTKEGQTLHFSRFGADYKEWREGKTPAPIEELHCPYQHTCQGLQSKDVNNLYKTRCNKHLSFGLITDCKMRKDMATCWKIYKGKK
jgi:hypothetical protein